MRGVLSNRTVRKTLGLRLHSNIYHNSGSKVWGVLSQEFLLSVSQIDKLQRPGTNNKHNIIRNSGWKLFSVTDLSFVLESFIPEMGSFITPSCDLIICQGEIIFKIQSLRKFFLCLDDN